MEPFFLELTSSLSLFLLHSRVEPETLCKTEGYGTAPLVGPYRYLIHNTEQSTGLTRAVAAAIAR
jgi:hypothetical protein